jgi:AcrR family transcriptional regulator
VTDGAASRDQGRAERARIVSVARRIAERDGADALTMRRLAAELGVAHTAIYWHVGDRSALLGAVADDFLAELGEITPRGRTPRRRMASIAHEVRRQVVEHRTLVALAMEHGRFPAMWFPAQVALAREISAVGRRGADAARAVASILYLAGAFVVLEAALEEHAGATQGTAQLWRDAADPQIDDGLRAHMAHGVDPGRVFDDVLDAVLDRIVE